ncbi:DUF7857 domain-containing protein [Halorussus salinisoli]|uniref:DUF7857 domain-containing protein n=1 Tax=Halorussus salinisoli TaxID=2558242 RepID=UPI0010C1E080|nr:hypothetical protein [Halorussus salinisoli]
MVELDWRVESRAGISLVELVVRNPTATARRIRVGNRLDAAVWPPRREGVSAAGWDDGGYEGVVASGGRRALGYASPVPVESSAEPPAELVWSERAGESEAEGDSDTFDADATPESVVRALGDPRPPADAVPAPQSSSERVSIPEPNVPEPVESWLSAVEERADHGGESRSEPSPEDRPAIRAVASRIERLRRSSSERARRDSCERPRSESNGESRDPRWSP